MKTIELDYQNIPSLNEELCLCLGYFDGVHRGHQKLLLEARKHSSKKIGVLTFDRPVSSLLNNGKSKEIITSNNDKIRIISRLGIDYLFIVKIDKNFLSFSPEDFINKILKKLGVIEVYVGEDYRFGKAALGDNSLLRKYFDVTEVNLLLDNGQKLSSSNIISHIKNGEIMSANKELGHNYQISGKVVEGHHRGISLGFPTENIELSSNYVIPKYGVYKTIIYISGIPHLSITNVGVHPTVGKEDKPVFEVHIPNYKSDDYGKTVYLEFLDFVREEKVFNTVEELKAQISSDLKSIQ